MFSRLRAYMRDYKQGVQILNEGYAKYSKHGRAWVSPTILCQPTVMLATSHISWFFKQPEDVLSNKVVQASLLEAPYVISDRLFENPLHNDIIRKDLTRNLESLTPGIVEEINVSLDEVWGTDTETWREVKVLETMQKLAVRTASRALVGLPLCRNEVYLKNAIHHAMGMALGGLVCRLLLPGVLKPALGHVAGLPCRYFTWRSYRLLAPQIKQHMEAIENEPSDTSNPEKGSSYSTLENIVRASLKHPDPRERSPWAITERPPEKQYVERIRDEAATVLQESNGPWTRSAVARLYLADSAIRESMRCSTVGGRGAIHEVMSKEGLTLPDGQFVPQGTYLGLPFIPIHRDEEFYPGPDEFDPERFLEHKPSIAILDPEKDGADRADEKSVSKKQALATTSETFLAFSHGRHACPGRFFAAHVLKLTLAEMLLRYDIQHLPERPVGKYISDFMEPPTKATISVRRRKATISVRRRKATTSSSGLQAEKAEEIVNGNV
ncbi:hypothetical protein H2199_000900 [Coniosporium tulheliwenetii]|uniref:Uncharacterized protein n=1 Tax=Coniosporium tulheliwenetii TaxID=3383036 RepID=A0ACC2ZNA4_9PEZI|nr:hypothetical protein H2199_000900 [Cladosporium sp. JES 115]